MPWRAPQGLEPAFGLWVLAGARGRLEWKGARALAAARLDLVIGALLALTCRLWLVVSAWRMSRHFGLGLLDPVFRETARAPARPGSAALRLSP